MRSGVADTVYSSTIRVIVKGDRMKIFILPEENLDRLYHRTMNYLDAKYHSPPTSLLSSQGDENQWVYDAEGRHEAARWDGWMGRGAHGKGKR